MDYKSRTEKRYVVARKNHKSGAVDTNEKRYVVTHKVYNVHGVDINKLCNSVVYYCDEGSYYDSEHKLSEIAYVQNELLFIKPVKGLRTIYCDFLVKNTWVALLITDTQTNMSKLFSKEDVLNSNILDYAYNASYINNRKTVRVVSITPKDMEDIDRKIQNNKKLYAEKQKREAERQERYLADKRKHEQTILKNIELGKKMVELMFKIDKSDILSSDAVLINSNLYLRYADYTGSEEVDGYMRIDKDGSCLYIKGWFLDEEYSLDYRRYGSVEVDDLTLDALGSSENISKASSCDDIGGTNEYYLSAKGRNYKVSMYLDSYDGFFSIKDASEFNGMSIKNITNIVRNKNTLDMFIRLHKLCKNFKEYSEKSSNPTLRFILAYLNSNDGSKYYDTVINMLKSRNFCSKIYFTILSSKLYMR